MRTFRSMSVRVPLAHYSRAALLCAVGLCALPQYAHAQQSNSVPVLGDLPVIGRLYQTPPVARSARFADYKAVVYQQGVSRTTRRACAVEETRQTG